MYDTVEEEFPEAWIELFDNHGQKTLKVEPPNGSNAEQQAKNIESYLSEKGLRTSLNKLNDEGTIYEVTATTDGW